MGNKKMGRPTDSPKDAEIKVRVDKDTLAQLRFCSDKMGITRSEVVRNSIRRTYEELQK